MPNAQVSRADGAQFQSWLHARQYPVDCSGTVGMYTRQDYFYSLGLGAQMVSLKYGLLWALLQGRVYHFPTSHYVNPVRCASRSFDCYFEPPSNCSRAIRETHAPPTRAHGGALRRRPWLASTTNSNRSEHRVAEEVSGHCCCNPICSRLQGCEAARLRGCEAARLRGCSLSVSRLQP